MAALKGDARSHDPKPADAAADPSPLARVMREFEQLVQSFETGLLRSLEDHGRAPVMHLKSAPRDRVRREACRLAISDLSNKYTRKYIHHSLNQAESVGKRVEDQLHNLSLHGDPDHDHDLSSLHNGYFRLYSTELFHLLGQPTQLRFGTLRFHKQRPNPVLDTDPNAGIPHHLPPQSPWITVELALNSSYYVADSIETLPYHTFRLPTAPSLQNCGILSRKPEDNGAFPPFDSWLLFTFLGNGCIKLELPIEMCADVYGGRLCGRENDEVLFWGFFVDDDVE